MQSERAVKVGILVAALGYFVDVYDLVLFSVVRTASLVSLGLTGDQLVEQGLFLLNVQNVGLFLGGILWGVLGDKRGRITVLFGSILLYSVANIANGFVHSIEAYAVWRFLAGIGLAGELGAGITLVSEMMPKEKRGYGTTIIATVGVAGAVVAGLVGDLFDWRIAYWVGGGMGLLLLGLRVAMHESGLFHSLDSHDVPRGSLLHLFANRERAARYLWCVLAGVPIWYVVGILITLAPEFARAFEVNGVVTAGRAILFTYIGLVLGDLSSGLLSQLLRSRRKVLFGFITLTAARVYHYLSMRGASLQHFYGACVFVGFAIGYWAVFVSTAAEQFGTNLRATVTTTVPNVVRGSAVVVNYFFLAFKAPLGMIQSAALVGAVTLIIALFATRRLSESFGRDLDFVER